MSDTLEKWHTYRADEDNFLIYVGGETSAPSDDTLAEPGVEYRMADRFEMNLRYLSELDASRPILVFLATCGGQWEAGMQMYSAILSCPNPVTVVATRWARSMSSIVPLAADLFLIRPPAKYMLHRGTMAFSGLDQEADTTDTERRKDTEMMLRIYTARLQEQGMLKGKPEVEIRQFLLNEMERRIDVWFSSEEAANYGFADAVLDRPMVRAQCVNRARRARMQNAITRPINITITIS